MIEKLFLLNILWIWGFYFACKVEFLDEDHPENGILPDSRNILWRIRYLAVKDFGWYWSKPICNCPPCMSSVHSIPFFGILCYLNGWGFALLWPLWVLSLTAVNYFIAVSISKLER